MPRLPQEQWAEIRARRETGASFGSLAKAFGVSKTAIMKRAKAEGWGDGSDIAELVRERAMAKVAGLVASDRQKREAAIEQAADSAAALLQRQRNDWEVHRQRYGHLPPDFEEAKLAKITAEMLILRQRGERAAWGLDDAAEKPQVTIVRQW